MGRLLLGMTLVAVMFIIQGVYLLKTGTWMPRSSSSSRLPTRLSLGRRVYYGSLYIAPAVAIIAVVAETVKRRLTVAEAKEYLGAAYATLFWAFVFLGFGIWGVVHPSGMVRWARQAHPDLAEDSRFALLAARLVAALFCAFGLVVLFSSVS